VFFTEKYYLVLDGAGVAIKTIIGFVETHFFNKPLGIIFWCYAIGIFTSQ